MTTKNSVFGKLTVVAALCSSAIMCASTASAAGFQLTEQSVAGMGRAHAGAGIIGDDVSAIHFNPAGMTLCMVFRRLWQARMFPWILITKG